jgi:hypothetical protein
VGSGLVLGHEAGKGANNGWLRARYLNRVRRCPFLALSLQQAAAKTRKERHKAKRKSARCSLSKRRDPAASRNEPQSAANVSFSAC